MIRRFLVSALLLVLIVFLAIASAVSYWMFIRPQLPMLGGRSATFGFALYPEFFHVAAGGGHNVTAFVQRSAGFSGAIRIEVVNPPSWVIYTPLTLNATDTNATFAVGASQNAPVTELNLTVRASSPGAVDQVATLDMKVVGVKIVTSNIASGVVYDTTKVLDGESLKALGSYQNGTFTFTATTRQLQSLARGDVMVVPPSTTNLANDGMMRLVLSTAQEGDEFVVQTIQASLFDEFQTLDVGAGNVNVTYSGPKTLGALDFSRAKSDTVFGSKPDITLDNTWITLFDSTIGVSERNIGGDVMFSAQGGLGAKLGPAIHIHTCDYVIPCLTMFKLHLIFWEDVTVSLKGSAGSQLNWDQTVLTLANGHIPLLDGVLWITFSLTLDGTANGPLNQAIDGYWHQGYSVELGPTWDNDNGWTWYQVSNGPNVDKHFQISLGSGSHAKLGIGPRADASINGSLLIASAGIKGWLAAYFMIVLNSQIPKPSIKPASWWVDWEIDGKFGIEFYLKVELVHTWSLDLCIPSDCNPGRISGPYSLFDGWPLPPLVKIASPHDGDTIDYNSLMIFPAFTATATGEDGNQCSGPKDHLVWSDEYGQIGTGCTLPSVKLQQDGIHHVTFTSTDSAGASSSTTVTVIVNVAKPDVYITLPHDGDTYIVGQSVTFVGYAMKYVNYYPCNQASGSLDFSIWLVSVLKSQPQSGTNYCTATTSFDKPRAYYIRLVARDSSGSIIAFSKLVKINVVAPSQTTNYPPIVQITPPPADGQSYIFSNIQIPLEGTVYDPEGDPLGTYTWSYTPEGLILPWNSQAPQPSPITIATGPLPSSSLCTANAPCIVKAALNAADYCKDNPAGGWVILELTATETAPVAQTGKSGPITIHLYCQQPVAVITPPIFNFTASRAGAILNVRTWTMCIRPQRRFCDGRPTGSVQV